MNENLSLQMLQRFTSQLVTVDTPVGSFAGVLRRAESSQHGGIGCLFLETRWGWMLVKAWTTIKRRT